MRAAPLSIPSHSFPTIVSMAPVFNINRPTVRDRVGCVGDGERQGKASGDDGIQSPGGNARSARVAVEKGCSEREMDKMLCGSKGKDAESLQG